MNTAMIEGHESVLLAAMMNGAAELPVTAEDFSSPPNRTIFEAVTSLRNRGLLAIQDELTERGQLESVGGAYRITEISQMPHDSESVQYALDCVLEDTRERRAAKIGDLLHEGEITIEEAQQQLMALERPRHDLPEAVPLITLAERESDPSKNLLGKRFLCRHGAMLYIGPSGTGKTSSSVQQDICWALGWSAFDIEPSRPMRTLCMQAENDDEDLAEIANGICDRLNLSDEEREVVRKNVIYVNERARTGEAFLQTSARLLEKFGPFDIFRIDTLHAYLGADILDVAATARFLRNGLNPILQKFDCGNILNHHTPKPTNRDTSNWRTADWMYSGAGNADLTNWARAALVIETTHAPDVFKFHAAKRGSRIGWCDEKGQKVYERMFCWDKGEKIYWRKATAEDAARVESSKPKVKGGRPEPGTEEDFLALVPKEGSINKYKLMENARAESMGEKRIGEKLARRYLAELLDERMLFKWRMKRTRTNPEIRISRHEQTLFS